MASLFGAIIKVLFHIELDDTKPVKKVVTGSEPPLDVENFLGCTEPEPKNHSHQPANPHLTDQDLDIFVQSLTRRSGHAR